MVRRTEPFEGRSDVLAKQLDAILRVRGRHDFVVRAAGTDKYEIDFEEAEYADSDVLPPTPPPPTPPPPPRPPPRPVRILRNTWIRS